MEEGYAGERKGRKIAVHASSFAVILLRLVKLLTQLLTCSVTIAFDDGRGETEEGWCWLPYQFRIKP